MRFKVVLFFFVWTSGLDTMAMQEFSERELDAFLRDAIENGYRKDVQPYVPLVVSVRYTIRKLTKFDITEQQMTTGGVFTFSWYDDRLAWAGHALEWFRRENITNQTIVEEVLKSFIESKNVWTPQFIKTNADVGEEGNFNILDENVFIFITADGIVHASMPVNLKTNCPVSAIDFPFDSHTCPILLLPWPFLKVTMDLDSEVTNAKLNSPGIDTFSYRENGEWILEDASAEILNFDICCPSLTTDELRLNFTFKRRASFFVYTLVLPTFIMSTLSSWTFMLPAKCGERLTYILTILLSYTVLLTYSGSVLPSHSDPLPWIALYQLVVFLTCGILTTLAAFNVHIYHKKNNVPTAVAKLVRLLRPKCKACKKDGDKDAGGTKYSEHWVHRSGAPEPDYPDDWEYGNTESSKHAAARIDKKHNNEVLSADRVTWKHVAYMLDAVYFFLSLFAVTAFNIIFGILALGVA